MCPISILAFISVDSLRVSPTSGGASFWRFTPPIARVASICYQLGGIFFTTITLTSEKAVRACLRTS